MTGQAETNIYGFEVLVPNTAVRSRLNMLKEELNVFECMTTTVRIEKEHIEALCVSLEESVSRLRELASSHWQRPGY